MTTSSSSKKKIKFHYGYGGTITPGGKLLYEGGTNGILKVDRGITYTKLVVKLWDACGPSMRLRCKLQDDLDSLVHVWSDEDLAYVLEAYDQCGEDLKIRVILDDTLRFSWANDELYCFRPKDFIMQVHTIELWDVCGPSMRLRCKLPNDDLDLLVHVWSDEDLAYVLEEYDQCGEDLKTRAIIDDTLRFSWANEELYCFRPKDFIMQVHTIEASR